MRPLVATYRLQFRGDMDFATAAAFVPHLAKLGVSHLYASPVMQAVPGSTHGYDLVDSNVLDPALGGAEGFEALWRALADNGIGLVLDLVPNHMGASPHNPWWRDVLEWGTSSPYAQYFDIDWSAPKLVVPALDRAYGLALRDGLFGLFFDSRDGGLSFTVGDLRLPLAPISYAQVLARLPTEGSGDLARRFAVASREDWPALRGDLAAMASGGGFGKTLAQVLHDLAQDHDALHALHEMQVWRLAHWRAARETLTYRRFFEIADLVGVKVERAPVFADAHTLVLELVEQGRIDGLRIDHVDGLADPKRYLQRLEEAAGGEQRPFILVEKILGEGERLRADWPIDGSTGYEFIATLADLYVDAEKADAMTGAYRAFTGRDFDYPAGVAEAKRRILARNLAGELDFLKGQAASIAARDPMTRDFGADTLRRAILEVAAALTVYRTYVDVDGASEEDRARIGAAVEAAKGMREIEDVDAVDFIGRALTLDFAAPEDQAAALEFTTRFQQSTGALMAKALEDTVFYRFNRLVALNEVGGDPSRYGGTIGDVHAAFARRLAEQPRGLSATATHDTKRGEDARARLYGLSEMPDIWGAAVARWHAVNAPHRTDLPDGMVPEPEIEWLFYQAVVGSWPPDLTTGDTAALGHFAERVAAYMLKAVREAKLRTTWTSPQEEYEEALDTFVRGALDPLGSPEFLADLQTFLKPVIAAGVVTSLSQTLVKLAAPGVPDIYQGTEGFDLSFVDPDNRRPLDTAALASLLECANSNDLDWTSGAVKARLLRAGLALRSRDPEFFVAGDYVPLAVQGPMADHVFAFARRKHHRAVVAIASRLCIRLLNGAAVPRIDSSAWGDTGLLLPNGLNGPSFVDVMTGQAHGGAAPMMLRDLLGIWPVALLATPDLFS